MDYVEMLNIFSSFGYIDFIFLVFVSFAFLSQIIFLGNRRLELVQELFSQCIEEKK
ncbi:hypothetical protein NCCP28_35660 [Niallia sp. NCCP-28]|nr:hypothetical protein NCCP28_35660 [Niallia sp. NCCP-28]